ncbi:MAG: phage major tail tube protein [Pseudomonadota bacterium]
MSNRLPKVLLGLNVYANGDDYMGSATKVKLGLPQPVTKEINSPGHAGAFDVPTSKWSKAEPEVTVQGINAELIALVGDPESANAPVSFIGAIGGYGEEQTVEIEITGNWTGMDAPDWENDANAEVTYKLSPQKYVIKIDGREVLFIDYVLNVVRVNGKERTASLNKALRAR